MSQQIVYSADQSQINLYIGAQENERLLQIQSLQCKNFAISSDYEFYLMGIAQAPLKFNQIFSQKARLEWSLQPTRVIHGIISEITDFGSGISGYRYRFCLSSPLKLLKLRQNHQIFLNKTVLEIILTILQAADWAHSTFQINCRHDYPILPYTVQYNESDYDFLLRLCMHFGIYFLFEQIEPYARLNFYDDWQLYPAANVTLPLITQSGQIPGNSEFSLPNANQYPSIFSLARTTYLLSDVIALQDINIEQPDIDLRSKTTKQSNLPSKGEWQYFGGHYQNQQEGQFLAVLMQEQIDWQRDIFTCCTDAVDLSPGQILTITNHPDNDFNGDYRIINITIAFDQPAGTPDFFANQAVPWQSVVTLIPVSQVYRTQSYAFPSAVTSVSNSLFSGNNESHEAKSNKEKKSVASNRVFYTPHSASVFYACIEGVGNDLTRAYVDKFGRYYLRQAFDYADLPKGQASSPMPRVQYYGGLGQTGNLYYGCHYPLYPGNYAAVTHLFGDFDRPIILGAVPTPMTKSSVTVANYTEHRLVTPAGHALIFDDKKQNERIELSTIHEQNQLLMNSARENSVIHVQTKHGFMLLKAERDLQLTANKDFIVKVVNSMRIIVENNQHVISEKGDQLHHSGADIIYRSKRDIEWQAQSDIQMLSKKNFSTYAKQNFSFTTKQGDQHFISREGQCCLRAKTIQFHCKQGEVAIGHDFAQIKAGLGRSLSISGTMLILEAPIIQMPQLT